LPRRVASLCADGSPPAWLIQIFVHFSRIEKIAMSTPETNSETEWRVEFFSSDVLRAQAKRKALRKKLFALFAIKLCLSGAVYFAYTTLVSWHEMDTRISYVNVEISQ
jgi:hypothetical protein